MEQFSNSMTLFALNLAKTVSVWLLGFTFLLIKLLVQLFIIVVVFVLPAAIIESIITFIVTIIREEYDKPSISTLIVSWVISISIVATAAFYIVQNQDIIRNAGYHNFLNNSLVSVTIGENKGGK